jgi:hypothetical protein
MADFHGTVAVHAPSIDLCEKDRVDATCIEFRQTRRGDFVAVEVRQSDGVVASWMEVLPALVHGVFPTETYQEIFKTSTVARSVDPLPSQVTTDPLLTESITAPIASSMRADLATDATLSVEQGLVLEDKSMMERIANLMQEAIARGLDEEAASIGISGRDQSVIAVLWRACEAVANLSLTAKGRGTLGKVQSLATHLAALARHANGQVAKHAASAIANLAYGSAARQADLGDAGAVDSLIATIERATQAKPASPDVVANVAAAVAVLCAQVEANAMRLAGGGGVRMLLELMQQSQLASNQTIQSHVVECLANVTRFGSRSIAKQVRIAGMSPIVLWCAAPNVVTQRNAALVIGNIAQDDETREVAGVAGAVDGLIDMLCTSSDGEGLRNAAWGLSNLAWSPGNQERMGRHSRVFVAWLLVAHEQDSGEGSLWAVDMHKDLRPTVRDEVVYFLCVMLGNMMFYNEPNRKRIADIPGGVSSLLRLTALSNDKCRPHLVRAIASGLASDLFLRDAVRVGVIGTVTSLLDDTMEEVQRYAAMCVCNLAAAPQYRDALLSTGAFEKLVAATAGGTDPKMLEQANAALELLKGVVQPEVLERRKAAIPDDKLSHLALSDEVDVALTAIEALVD